MISNPYKISLSKKNILYLGLFNSITNEALVLKRTRISTKPVKYSSDLFETHSSNPMQCNLRTVANGELEIVNGELSNGFGLVTIEVSYKEFTDGKLAESTILSAVQELKMISERSEEDILSALSIVHDEIEKVRSQLHELQVQANSIKSTALKRLAMEQNVDVEDLEYGCHTCDSNSNLHCVYNITEDPARDECLRCGMPHERK